MDVNIKKYLKPPPSNGWMMKISFGIQPILQGLLLLLSSREATWKIIPGRPGMILQVPQKPIKNEGFKP